MLLTGYFYLKKQNAGQEPVKIHEGGNKMLGENIKKLGFGLMRLPKIGQEEDIEQTKQMVDIFMSKGFTYFDTAYVYDNGKSEMALKKPSSTAIPGTASTARPSFRCGARRAKISWPDWRRNLWIVPASNTLTSIWSTVSAGSFSIRLSG